MHHVDRLQRSNHDLELDDLSLVVALDHVNAVDVLAPHLGFKLQHRLLARENFFQVNETAALLRTVTRGSAGRFIAAENRARRAEIKLGDGLALLRGEYHRRIEDHVVGQQLIEKSIRVIDLAVY